MSTEKNNIFMTIRQTKADTAKEILATFGEPYDEMATILTADELVKLFDYFALHTELTDDDEIEEALFTGYGCECIEKNLLSLESIYRIRKEVDTDFIVVE